MGWWYEDGAGDENEVVVVKMVVVVVKMGVVVMKMGVGVVKMGWWW